MSAEEPRTMKSSAVKSSAELTGTTADAVAGVVGSVFSQLEQWRDELVPLGGSAKGAELDELVERLVMPELTRVDPLFVGAGFVAAPEFVHDRDVSFSWWLGPFESTPLAAATTEPTRFDVKTRSHMEYVRNFGSLEWYSVPATTRGAHITGPYVDQLCTVDYILTFTLPVVGDEGLMGVVGADVLVSRFERELLPLFLDPRHPLTLVNGVGRVIVSSDPTVPAGALDRTPEEATVPCPGTPFRVVGPRTMAAA